MSVRVGINGMGRIGRAVLRGIIERPDTPIEVVGINDITPLPTVAHLLRYDSTYGPWSAAIETGEDHAEHQRTGRPGLRPGRSPKTWTGRASASTSWSRRPAASAPARVRARISPGARGRWC